MSHTYRHIDLCDFLLLLLFFHGIIPYKFFSCRWFALFNFLVYGDIFVKLPITADTHQQTYIFAILYHFITKTAVNSIQKCHFTSIEPLIGDEIRWENFLLFKLFADTLESSQMKMTLIHHISRISHIRKKKSDVGNGPTKKKNIPIRKTLFILSITTLHGVVVVVCYLLLPFIYENLG